MKKMDTDAKSEYEFVVYNRKDGEGFNEDFTKLVKEASLHYEFFGRYDPDEIANCKSFTF